MFHMFMLKLPGELGKTMQWTYHRLCGPPRCNLDPQTRWRFVWFNRRFMAELAMKKIKSPRPIPQPPLAAGQLWRMAEANLQVLMVGKLLVHYKLGKLGAVRVPHSCNCIKTIEKYLKTKNALLA
jgi:hypothetical protein